jgi:hypothetical protein
MIREIKRQIDEVRRTQNRPTVGIVLSGGGAKRAAEVGALKYIEELGIPVDFVCGTLFGSGSGRVRDIVLDWIAVLKGWKPRTVSDGEGRRRVVWENAGDENLASVELAGESDSLELIDEEPLRAEASRVLAEASRRARVGVEAASLLLYATSHDISLTEPCILSALGAGKSKAYAWRDKVMKALERTLKSVESGETALFARLLVASAAAHLGLSARSALLRSRRPRRT